MHYCMRYLPFFLLVTLVFSCKTVKEEALSAQQIIDRAIESAGGGLYTCSEIDFMFRDRMYILEYQDQRKVLKRIFKEDTATITDIRRNDHFERLVDDNLVSVPDTMARKYANSINSVHYFAYLPYGLNDPAVNKKLLGERTVKEKDYYVVEVTFDQEGGGDDYEDVYIYWFNKETFSPDYLAYEFHVDGGGMRFREAFNERFIEGIRFVDYSNYKPLDSVSIYDIDRLYVENKLELLSRIELNDIRVNADNCN